MAASNLEVHPVTKTPLALASLLLAGSVLAVPATAEEPKAAPPSAPVPAVAAPTASPAPAPAATATAEPEKNGKDRKSFEERKAKHLAKMKTKLEKRREALKKMAAKIADFKGAADQKTLMEKRHELVVLEIAMFEKKLAAMEAAKDPDEMKKVMGLPDKDVKNPHKSDPGSGAPGPDALEAGSEKK